MSENHSSEQSPVVEYRDVPGFPGYRVGDDGSVWSCRLYGGAIRGVGSLWRPIATYTCKSGYVIVRMSCWPKPKTTRKLHRVILESFVGVCPDGMECRHLNGKKADNRLSNICWGTKAQNVEDNKTNGVRIGARGEDHGHSAIDEETARAIRSDHESSGIRQCDIARKYGVSDDLVHFVIKRKTWKHI